MKLNIFRFDSSVDAVPSYRSYVLPAQEEWTVLQALDYIYDTVDRSLGYRNYRCFEGVCLSCMVVVNGKPVKGCETLLSPGKEYTIDPLKGYPIIRDLVVDYGQERTDQQSGKKFLIKTGTLIEGRSSDESEDTE
jgi:fumarate reductase iron-sulfur subunit